MLTIIPSKNRARDLQERALKLVPDAYVIVADEEERALYELQGVPADNLLVCNSPRDRYGKSRAIAWAYERMAYGEWMFILDDKVSRIQHIFDPGLSVENLAMELVWACEEEGANYGGIRTNPSKRLQHTHDIAEIPVGGFIVIRKTDLVIPIKYEDDRWLFFEHLWHDGKVVRMHSIRYDLEMGLPGGHGRLQDRTWMDEEARELKVEYRDAVTLEPNLWVPGMNAQVTAGLDVKAWRTGMGFWTSWDTRHPPIPESDVHRVTTITSGG